MSFLCTVWEEEIRKFTPGAQTSHESEIPLSSPSMTFQCNSGDYRDWIGKHTEHPRDSRRQFFFLVLVRSRFFSQVSMWLLSNINTGMAVSNALTIISCNFANTATFEHVSSDICCCSGEYVYWFCPYETHLYRFGVSATSDYCSDGQTLWSLPSALESANALCACTRLPHIGDEKRDRDWH